MTSTKAYVHWFGPISSSESIRAQKSSSYGSPILTTAHLRPLPASFHKIIAEPCWQLSRQTGSPSRTSARSCHSLVTYTFATHTPETHADTIELTLAGSSRTANLPLCSSSDGLTP